MTEENRIEEIREKAEAAEEEVRAKEKAAGAKALSSPRKGLMERRESFAQSSVPNAHRGYSGKPPRIMLGIIAVLFLMSFILAAITG
jgi:hypothetical protein